MRQQTVSEIVDSVTAIPTRSVQLHLEMPQSPLPEHDAQRLPVVLNHQIRGASQLKAHGQENP